MWSRLGCMSRSIFTVVLLFFYLYLLDFAWLFLPKPSAAILFFTTLLMIGIAFKLATVTAHKIFLVMQRP